jgi:hypothetical protein
MNAIERLAGTYQGERNSTEQDLAIAQGQLRDHQARLGRPFAYDAYLTELAGLRDQLKAGLSQATPEPGTSSVSELAERIKSLKAAHTIDAAPERTTPRRIAAEEPVTARIRRRSESMPAIEPSAEREPVATPVETPKPVAVAPVPQQEPAPVAEIHSICEPIPAMPVRHRPAYRQQLASRRQNDRQLSLF